MLTLPFEILRRATPPQDDGRLEVQFLEEVTDVEVPASPGDTKVVICVISKSSRANDIDLDQVPRPQWRTSMRTLRVLLILAISVCCQTLQASTYVVPPDDALISRTDTIVIARAIHSFVEESGQRGIETVTTFTIEDVLKGEPSLQSALRVRSPGGTIVDGKQSRVESVPGAPRFVAGARVLLFLRAVGDGDFATTDLALGLFGFATDDLGHHVLVRDRSEIVGWDPDGSVHQEPSRDADRFLAFIRNVVNHRTATNDYTLMRDPRTPNRSITATRLVAAAASIPAVTQYLFASTATETSQASRWKIFPAAVSWNRGNTMANVGNSGSDVINSAFNSWNGDPSSNVNFVLTGTSPNANGIFDPADGANNVVFETDMNFRGVAAFSCTTGGVIGSGGIHTAVTDATNTLNGEVFYRITETDVSTNQGVASCLPGGANTLKYGNFVSAITHEFGHCLSFRHSDKSRNGTQDCTSLVNYDCSSTAIMNHLLVDGLNGVLTAWDQRALAATYPAPTTPANLVATATSSTSVGLTWAVVAGVTSYTVYRSADNATWSNVGASATNSFTDVNASTNTAYLYKVASSVSGVESSASNRDLATTGVFTDAALTPQTTQIKAAHITELRLAVNAVRKLANAGLTNDFNFTDPVITASSTEVQRIHVIELRSALDAARSTLGVSALSYTDPAIAAQSTFVKAVHFAELRAGVQ